MRNKPGKAKSRTGRCKRRLEKRTSDNQRRDLGKHHRKSEFSIRDIEPVWERIYITEHAMCGFMDRYPKRLPNMSARAWVIKNCIVNGRRSDRDKTLTEDIAPYLLRASWEHDGRPVTLFMNHEYLCCLVVKNSDETRGDDALVVLTCFMAS